MIDSTQYDGVEEARESSAAEDRLAWTLRAAMAEIIVQEILEEAVAGAPTVPGSAGLEVDFLGGSIPVLDHLVAGVIGVDTKRSWDYGRRLGHSPVKDFAAPGLHLVALVSVEAWHLTVRLRRGGMRTTWTRPPVWIVPAAVLGQHSRKDSEGRFVVDQLDSLADYAITQENELTLRRLCDLARIDVPQNDAA